MTVNNLIEILSSLSEQERKAEILIEGNIYSNDWGDYTNQKYFSINILDKNGLRKRTVINNITKKIKTWWVIPAFSEKK